MHSKEIKTKLEARGDYISPNYGLILENENDELVIAEIRFSQQRVILPKDSDERKREKISKLKRVLQEENIPHRDAYNYMDIANSPTR